jgi:uncharacterized protein (TIGR03083 family)
MQLTEAQVAALLTAIGDGAGTATALPPALRERVVQVALVERPAGRPAGSTSPPPSLSRAIAAFRRQIVALGELLGSLRDADWDQPTAADWTVHELVSHLIEVEEYLGSVLGLWQYAPPLGTEHDHRSMTQPAITRRAGESARSTVAAWRGAIDRLFDAIGDGSRLPSNVTFHTLPMSSRNVFVLRAFEVWTHHDDVRRALGLPLTEPPAEDVQMMTTLSVRSTPLGIALAGVDRHDRTARVVLTGTGGGTWVVGFGDGAPAEPDTTMIADAIEFCRMAANRVEVHELALDVEGDLEFALDVCAGARIFAA